VAPDEALKLSSEAVVGLDKSLDVPNPGAAVMATELYEARNVSFSRDDFLLIPDVPRQTLNALMRGRVEETTGLALLRQGKAEEASVRFRRALTVLPKDSAWWRSATWNLGTSLAAEGKDKEALDTMISSYAIDKPNVARYILIEQLWIKFNGSREGLERRIGPNPLPDFTASALPKPSVEASPENGASSDPESKSVTEGSPTPEASPSPALSPEATSTPSSAANEVKAPTPEPSPSPDESPTPEITPTPDVSPTPEVTLTPEISPSPESSPASRRSAPSSAP
jgi:hypothetical protein